LKFFNVFRTKQITCLTSLHPEQYFFMMNREKSYSAINEKEKRPVCIFAMMGNAYFSFKQFTVFHDRCAMKTGTDGVLLGAWVEVNRSLTRVLDIGTGSGLIALMLAQRCDAMIDGIEPHRESCRQAKENAAASPWSNRITIIEEDLQTYTNHCKKTYELIVCNPPYFSRSLKPPEEARQMARHSDALPPSLLMLHASRLLSPEGTIALIFPFENKENFHTAAAAEGLFEKRETLVKTLPPTKPFRVLAEYTFVPSPIIRDELCIYNESRDFSREYRELTKDFYLHF